MEEKNKYDDIIDLPHHTSPKHPRMSAIDRAAQFSPFAALTGYEDAVEETVRLTEVRLELSEDEKLRINEQLRIIIERINELPSITVVYFVPDKKKDGGSYVSATGKVKLVDEYEKNIVFTDKTLIPIDQIREISADFLDLI